jgi:hypothetical protein
MQTDGQNIEINGQFTRINGVNQSIKYVKEAGK